MQAARKSRTVNRFWNAIATCTYGAKDKYDIGKHFKNLRKDMMSATHTNNSF